MNTQLAFAFGMLAMIAIGMIIVIVVGMVKVHRQGNAITSLEKWIDNTNLSADQNMQVLERRIIETERDFQTSLTVKQNRFEQYTDELKRDLMAYTDSRIDKALGTTKKQILND